MTLHYCIIALWCKIKNPMVLGHEKQPMDSFQAGVVGNLLIELTLLVFLSHVVSSDKLLDHG
jgi:hypothetical protein